MRNDDYETDHTALLMVDPYNDFVSPGGLLWPAVEEVATNVNLIQHLSDLLTVARDVGIQFVVVPHRQWESGDFDDWAFPNPSQISRMKKPSFVKGTWGAEFREEFRPQQGDIVVAQHWAQSGFANTDLDFQLKQHRITHVILVGMLANSCIESTARYAMELGYHVTLVTDATAAFSADLMHAAHKLNGPTFAHSITTTETLAARLRAL